MTRRSIDAAVYTAFILLFVFCLVQPLRADDVATTGGKTGVIAVDPRVTCPDATPCKIVLINDQEEKILLSEKGILATAAQARSLDLGSLVTYFQQKIAKAPAGDVQKAQEAAPKADKEEQKPK